VNLSFQDIKNAKRRFWPKVDKRGPNECWEWARRLDPDGYGSLSVTFSKNNDKEIRANRFSLMLKLGRLLKPGLCALHNCPGGDNPSCVNPVHLWEGSIGDNMKDKMKKGRFRGNTHIGTQCSRAKLTEKKVLAVRKEHATGKVTYAELGRRHKMHPTSIRSLVLRDTWKHI